MNSYENGEPIFFALERDLGIVIEKNLGISKRTFWSRGEEMRKKLYTSYVRPQLEFAIPATNPYSEGDINILERVLKSFNYGKGCEILKIISLKKKRTWGDLIRTFKIENNLDEVKWLFKPNCGQPRGGHRGYFLRETVKNCDQSYNFINNRIANGWNKLSNEII